MPHRLANQSPILFQLQLRLWGFELKPYFSESLVPGNMLITVDALDASPDNDLTILARCVINNLVELYGTKLKINRHDIIDLNKQRYGYEYI